MPSKVKPSEGATHFDRTHLDLAVSGTVEEKQCEAKNAHDLWIVALSSKIHFGFLNYFLSIADKKDHTEYHKDFSFKKRWSL